MITVSHWHSVEDNFETVAMTDEEAVSFGIQRSLEFDDQDRATGMDTYCLVADSGAASYGGLREWVRAGEGTVVLILADSAADELGLPSEFELDIDPLVLDEIDPIVRRLIVPGHDRVTTERLGRHCYEVGAESSG